METRIMENIRVLVETVQNNPGLQKILEEDCKPEISLLLQEEIREKAFMVGFDFLVLIRKTAKKTEEGGFNVVKTRRRLEEHLRKYATNQFIIGLAIFFDIPIT